MNELTLTLADALGFLNTLVSSVVVILAFSLLAYTLTYNFRHPVARRFAFLLGLVMVTYASEVALTQVVSAESASKWLRFEWLGIAFLPGAYFAFSYAVLRTTNYHTDRRRLINVAIGILSVVSALLAFFTTGLVGIVEFDPLLSYLTPGVLFWPFAAFFAGVVILSHLNIWKARQRCLTAESRKRMTYLLLASAAPGIGTFPYLIALGKSSVGLLSPELILSLAIVGNSAVGAMLIGLSYTVAFFGVYTPDRVVRYRLIRYFARGPVVAIIVILAVQTIPTVERILGLPRNIVLFSVITGVIVAAQVILSVSRELTDRLVYGEDRQEIAWLRELDRRLLTTTDLRQFLENHLTVLCELLRVPSGFVAAAIGTDLILEAMVGPEGTRQEILDDKDWSDAMSEALSHARKNGAANPARKAQVVEGGPAPSENGRMSVRQMAPEPAEFGGYWLWPVLEPAGERKGEIVLGMLGVRARSSSPHFSAEERALLAQQIDSVAKALLDRKMQMQVMVVLRRIIPGIDRIQQIRGIVPYVSENTEVPPSELLEPSPIHNPEFESWVKDALSHYWGGPKLTRSPLMQLRVVDRVVEEADGNPGKALRLVLGRAIQNLRPGGKQDLSTPEWLLYNILEMRFIQGRRIRDIAGRLAISESDLYRKQRVAIGQVAQVLTEMEQGDWDALLKLQEEDSSEIVEESS
ncbi:MAG: hypothetical protein F4Z82_00480 [Caldilineaceae bacterium SB0668_bin_21]|nr:hypothetical protein [Caldilineaceae bacterium SB0668_bin_21]MYC24275.1 hypothetical protein [Caldilineaceae bacterium SB0662_bin_25]